VKPRFTDAHRYPHGYVPANKTDVAATHKRVRKQIADQARADAAVLTEQTQKVLTIKRK